MAARCSLIHRVTYEKRIRELVTAFFEFISGFALWNIVDDD
jgi:hypothetical protein